MARTYIHCILDEKYSILVADHEFHGRDLYTACIYLYSDEKYSILVVDHEIRQISCQGIIHYIYICIGSHE